MIWKQRDYSNGTEQSDGEKAAMFECTNTQSALTANKMATFGERQNGDVWGKWGELT